MDIGTLLQLTIDRNASDLHIISGYYPSIRVNGDLYQLNNTEVITATDAKKLLFELISSEQKENLLSNREIDLGIDYNGHRFRLNIYYTKNGLSGAFRLISTTIKTIEELNLPAIINKTKDLSQGLVLLTGPTGEGKSTTLAAIINDINTKYSKHIITIEDPVEYVYPVSKSIISQRELHQDTHSWQVALRSALREDPDVILVGEMRDYDTIDLALTAAETGHLVFSTLHTSSASEAINRMIDIFPANQQNQIKSQLSAELQMVVSQKLLPRLDKPGRIPAAEILIINPAVASLIREGKTHLINNVMLTSEGEGMILFEKCLSNLYQAGKISRDTAMSYAIRPKELENLI